MWWKKLLEILGLRKKPTPPPAPAPDPAPKLHPRNDPAQKCAWHEASGAPQALVEGRRWRVRWGNGKDGKPGVWSFEYHANGAPGLYKPSSWDHDGKIVDNNRLLLLARNPLNGQPLRPEHIGRAYHAHATSLDQPIAWCRWPGDGPLSNKPIDGNQIGRVWTAEESAGYMFGSEVKIRSAKPPSQGMAIVVEDIFLQRLFAWGPTDIHCREDV